MTMTSAILYYGSGWAAAKKAEVRKNARDDGNGGKRWCYTAMIERPFHIGSGWKRGDEIELVIKDGDGKRLHYHAVVEGMARSGTTKILLTSAGNADTEVVQAVIKKIGELNNGRTGIAR